MEVQQPAVLTNEYTKYVLRKVSELLDNKIGCFTTSFIANYGICNVYGLSTDEEVDKINENYPQEDLDSKQNELIDFYRKNNKLPTVYTLIITQIRHKPNLLEFELKISAPHGIEDASELLTFEYLQKSHAPKLPHNEISYGYSNETMPSSLDIGYQVPKKDIINIVTELFNRDSIFPDYPEVICNLSAAKEICVNRTLDELRSKYKRVIEDFSSQIVDIRLTTMKQFYVTLMIDIPDQELVTFIVETLKAANKKYYMDEQLREFYDYFDCNHLDYLLRKEKE